MRSDDGKLCALEDTAEEMQSPPGNSCGLLRTVPPRAINGIEQAKHSDMEAPFA